MLLHCYTVLSVTSHGVASPDDSGSCQSRRPVLHGVICRVARCYRVLSVASPGVTGCYLSRRPVLQGVICRVARCCKMLSVASPGVIPGVICRVARCCRVLSVASPVLYRVLSVASPGVAGCYLSRRPVLQGVICRVARCYRVFELSCSCLLAQHVVYLFMALRVMVPANIVW